ncbi:MAG: hypothetical protein JSR53_16100, partial [Proteobacteria bacterium]|nr:hypothetical protein [Pseudomonadota bacterium]
PAPEPTNSREVFSARTFAFYAAMAGFIAQVNAAIAWVATQLTAISGHASIASAARDDAMAAAAAASLSANAAKWVSGQAYADGALAWSPSSWQTYRRKGAGGGTIDPVNDPGSWEPIARDAVGALVSIAGNATAQRFQTYSLSGAAIVLTLPAVAYSGDWVGIVPPPAQTNSAQKIARNGHLIIGLAEDMDIDVRQPFRLAYISPAAGWCMAA